MTTLPIAGESFYSAVERLHRNLDAVHRILTDESSSTVRLVVNPEKMVISEARRTYTYLGLFGYRCDAVVVNRIIPEDVTDPYFGKWKDIQAEHLQTVRESFEPVPILTARLFDREMVGVQLLEEMGQEVYGDLPVTDVLYRDDPIRVRRRSGGYVLTMRLPFVSREDMDIHRRGEAYVRVGTYKRNLILQTLSGWRFAAQLVGDHLEIVSRGSRGRRAWGKADVAGQHDQERRSHQRPRRRETEGSNSSRCARSRSARSAWR
jgi:arsenite-transporting ATPase